MAPAQHEPLFVRRSLRVASMTDAKFGDSPRDRSEERGNHSPSRRKNLSDDTPLAGAGRRANTVDLSMAGRANVAYTPSNQYGRAMDLMDPFSSVTPYHRPYLNLDLHRDVGANTPMDIGHAGMDYPSSRDRQALNLPSSADNILTETPSRFAFLPSLSRFTPFVTPRMQPDSPADSSNSIVTTVKTRRRNATPKEKRAVLPSSPLSTPSKRRPSVARPHRAALRVLLYSTFHCPD